MFDTDIRDRADELAATAVALRAERQFNCAQAVACALAPEIDADPEACFRLSEAFGAGMGGHRETCGAISGGIMALGWVRSGGTEAAGATKRASYALADELVERFREQNGATACCELKGIGCEHGMLRSCPGCIEDATRMTIDILAAYREGKRG